MRNAFMRVFMDVWHIQYIIRKFPNLYLYTEGVMA